jgi:CO/xanthine dehydrogenase FAD-binding subunit
VHSDAAEYDLVAPGSLADVLRMLAESRGNLRPIAGGTELMVALAAGRLAHRTFVSLAGLRELRFIEVSGEGIHIGSGATFTDLRRHPMLGRELPLLAQAASWTGSIANQNRATLGGNLANASPAADAAPALLIYDAELTLVRAAGSRTLPYRDFHLGYKQTALGADELIHSITVKRGLHQGRVSYLRKVGTRNAMAISKVVLAGLGRLEGEEIAEIRLAGGSLQATPVRLVQTEAALVGRPRGGQTLAAARAALTKEIKPIDDIRSTAQYRVAVAANLLEEFLHML